jgi:hypothetical protein
VEHEILKNKRLVISKHIEYPRDNMHIYCTQDSAFGVYCKTRINTINEDYVLAEQNDNISHNITPLENMERSYYGIYKDHILFA